MGEDIISFLRLLLLRIWQTFPPQLKATKGPPLLTEDPCIYRWVADIREVVGREIATPLIDSKSGRADPSSLRLWCKM